MNRYLWSTSLIILVGALLLLPACAADAQFEIQNQAGRSFAVVNLEAANETTIEGCTDLAELDSCTVSVPASQSRWFATAYDAESGFAGGDGCWTDDVGAVAESGVQATLYIGPDLTDTLCIGAGAVCGSTCATAGDGECDDGGLGSLYDVCDLGTDCADCGARAP